MRMKSIHEKVASVWNHKHSREERAFNKGRAQPPPFCIGDLVWYIGPPGSGNKLDTRWIGPGVVVAKEGESSYQIEIKPGHTMGAQGGALKLYTPDKQTKAPLR